MVQRCLACSFTIIVMLNFAGCVTDSVSRGQSFKVDTRFDLYFVPGVDPEQSWASQGQRAMRPEDSDKSYPVSDETIQQVIANPLWTAPDGIVLQDTELKIGPRDLQWFDTGTMYKMRGYRLEARCSATVTQNAKAGSTGNILLRLPGLKEVSSAAKAQVRCPSRWEAFAGPDTLQLRTLVVK